MGLPFFAPSSGFRLLQLSIILTAVGAEQCMKSRALTD